MDDRTLRKAKALEDTIHAGQVAATTASFGEMAGGQPLVIDGELVGAIGVSSAQPDWDVTLADAGAQVLSSQPRPEKPKRGD